MSSFFNVSNRVRQGEILSLSLFNLYMYMDDHHCKMQVR